MEPWSHAACPGGSQDLCPVCLSCWTISKNGKPMVEQPSDAVSWLAPNFESINVFNYEYSYNFTLTMRKLLKRLITWIDPESGVVVAISTNDPQALLYDSCGRLPVPPLPINSAISSPWSRRWVPCCINLCAYRLVLLKELQKAARPCFFMFLAPKFPRVTLVLYRGFCGI